MKKTLYILQDGQLHRKHNSLYFESEKGRKFIPVENTNDIYILGEVIVSKRFLEFASQKQICVHYFNISGEYIGTYYPREHYSSGHIIVKQVQHCIDDKKRIILAKSFADGHINQNIRVIKYYEGRAEGKEKEILGGLIFELDEYCNKIEIAKTNEELETIIQNAYITYKKSFDFILSAPSFIYNKKQEDVINQRRNAIFKFGEEMCNTIVLSEVYKTYLDPRVGYLHKTDSTRFVLNLDVAYVFRAIMVDRLIFMLTNRRTITKGDFVKEEDRFILSRTGKEKFIKELDKRMRTTVKHSNLGRYVSYRRLIRLELYKIQKHILGEMDYKPYETLW